MEFGDTPEEAAFRAEARAWLEANAPRRSDTAADRPAFEYAGSSIEEQDDHEREEIARASAWQNKLYDQGWAGITWPKEFGGRGGTPLQHIIFQEELAAFDVPFVPFFPVSLGMVGPVLMTHGTDKQKEEHLPKILRGDEFWCQLFSEPGAGSDLAGLQTRATRDEGGWIVNGQKVWTTGARFAHYGALVARTDGSVPKHRGLTYFMLDMKAPGIDIRPLRQVTGDAHFNEVFLTDVFIPDEHIVGDLNDGWRVANTMLLNERGGFTDRFSKEWDDLLSLARQRGKTSDAAVRQELAKIYGRDQVIQLLNLSSRTAMSKGTSMPMIASVAKVLSGQRNKQLTALALDLLGADTLVIGPEGYNGGSWQERFLSAPVGRIAGGTDEVQKNIIGERFLGIPKEPRADKDVAFDDLPKA